MIPNNKRDYFWLSIIIILITGVIMVFSNQANGQCTTGQCNIRGRNGQMLVPIRPSQSGMTTQWRPSSGQSMPLPGPATRPSGLTVPPSMASSASADIRPSTVVIPATTIRRSSCRCPDYHKAILAKLGIIETRLAAIEAKPSIELPENLVANIVEELKNALTGDLLAVDNTDVLGRLEQLEETLTAIAQTAGETAQTQERIAETLILLAEAHQSADTKLDRAIALLEEGLGPVELTLTVQSAVNLPASYVDTSAIWALQRETGLSHVVLVINSVDPEWERLQPLYRLAANKFPAIQLVDVVAANIKISPTPQLVLYYIDGRDPEIIEGDRPVASKLRELYTN